MKKVLISFFLMTLTLTNLSLANISSVQATTADNTIKVSLENIRDIILENSLNIKIQHNNVQIKKEYYEDAKDAKNVKENAKKDAEDKLKNLKSDSTATDDQIKKAQAVVDDTKEAADDADKTLSDTKKAYRDAKTDYTQKFETEVYAAQKAYIDYLSDISNAKLEQDTVKSSESKEQVAKFKYERGFLSKNNYISLTHDNSDSINKFKELRDTEELSRIKLCTTLGINPEENIAFNTDINADFQIISQINYEDDLKKMLSNNIDISVQNDTIGDLKDKKDDYKDDGDEDIYDYEVENADNELKKLIDNAEIEFKEQYNTLINSYNSVTSSYNKILQEQKESNLMQAKFEYGFVSKTEVENSKSAYDKDNAIFIKEKNQLYIDYLRYIQMKEGY